MKTRTIITLVSAALLMLSCKPKVPIWEVSAKLENGIFSWSNDIVEYSVYVQDPANDGRPKCGISAKVRNQEGNLIELASDSLLGYGASAPVGTSGIYLPDRPCSTAEVLMRTPDQITVHLAYDIWKIDEAEITLDKQITLTAGSPVMKVIDCWNGPFEKLNVAIGMPSSQVYSRLTSDHTVLFSDSNGTTSILSMPESNGNVHQIAGYLMLRHEVASGEALYYYAGVSADGPDKFLDMMDNLN